MTKSLAKLGASYLSIRSAWDAASLGLKVSADMQTAEVGLTTLLGSAEKAHNTINRLKVEAARTPFELPGLTAAVQLLTSVTKDGDKSIDTVLNIGEALAAMGKGQAELDRISVNLQQIAAVGKASTLDIKQFAFAGIPIYEMLAETTGKNGEALQQLIEDGGVTFDVLTKMFDQANNAGGRFFGAFQNQSGTFNQAASNMKDSFGIMMSDIVNSSGLFAGVTSSMTQLSGVMSNWRGVVDAVQSSATNLFATLDSQTLLITHLKGVFDGLVTTITTTLKPALDELWIALQPLMPYITALAEVAVGGLVIALHTFIAALGVIGQLLAFTLAGLTNLVTFIVDTAVYAFRTMQNAVEIVAAVFRGDWGGALDGVKNQISDLVDWVNNLIDAFKRAIDLATEMGGGSIDFMKKILPGRATGGPVTGGAPYMVGEKGPELFVPHSSGSIIPNNKLSGGGSGISIVVTGNTLLSDDVAERIGDMIMNRLKLSNAL